MYDYVYDLLPANTSSIINNEVFMIFQHWYIWLVADLYIYSKFFYELSQSISYTKLLVKPIDYKYYNNIIIMWIPPNLRNKEQKLTTFKIGTLCRVQTKAISRGSARSMSRLGLRETYKRMFADTFPLLSYLRVYATLQIASNL